uniref:Uncharacterized protein n=1 Tax=Nelumbo nucifera TaxID=4432 RepID=A0A822YJY9_NELNU|nr:TPA_asm: hypothetical protein HUJ06_011663 [Nelumbo nucifera]
MLEVMSQTQSRLEEISGTQKSHTPGIYNLVLPFYSILLLILCYIFSPKAKASLPASICDFLFHHLALLKP